MVCLAVLIIALSLIYSSYGEPTLKEKSGSYFNSYGQIGNIGPGGRHYSMEFANFGQGGNGGLGFDIPVYSYIDGLGSLGRGKGNEGSDYPGYGYGLGYFGGLPSYPTRYG